MGLAAPFLAGSPEVATGFHSEVRGGVCETVRDGSGRWLSRTGGVCRDAQPGVLYKAWRGNGGNGGIAFHVSSILTSLLQLYPRLVP